MTDTLKTIELNGVHYDISTPTTEEFKNLYERFDERNCRKMSKEPGLNFG